LEPFFATAGRVINMDGKRAQSIAYMSNLSGAEYDDAVNRNTENAAIAAWVCGCLHERVAAYRFALERLAITVPSASAAEADRSINLLYTRLGSYCGAGAVVASRRVTASSRVVTKD
jgi:hypothetical protein